MESVIARNGQFNANYFGSISIFHLTFYNVTFSNFPWSHLTLPKGGRPRGITSSTSSDLLPRAKKSGFRQGNFPKGALLHLRCYLYCKLFHGRCLRRRRYYAFSSPIFEFSFKAVSKCSSVSLTQTVSCVNLDRHLGYFFLFPEVKEAWGPSGVSLLSDSVFYTQTNDIIPWISHFGFPTRLKV